MNESSHLKGPDRSDLTAIRSSLCKLGLIVAEVDRDLRYVWLDNPHPDFHIDAIVGKRDDELIADVPAAEIMALKREVLRTKLASSKILALNLSDGWRHYSVFVYPIRNPDNSVESLLMFAFDAFGSALEVP